MGNDGNNNSNGKNGQKFNATVTLTTTITTTTVRTTTGTSRSSRCTSACTMTPASARAAGQRRHVLPLHLHVRVHRDVEEAEEDGQTYEQGRRVTGVCRVVRRHHRGVHRRRDNSVMCVSLMPNHYINSK